MCVRAFHVAQGQEILSQQVAEDKSEEEDEEEEMEVVDEVSSLELIIDQFNPPTYKHFLNATDTPTLPYLTPTHNSQQFILFPCLCVLNGSVILNVSLLSLSLCVCVCVCMCVCVCARAHMYRVMRTVPASEVKRYCMEVGGQCTILRMILAC